MVFSPCGVGTLVVIVGPQIEVLYIFQPKKLRTMLGALVRVQWFPESCRCLAVQWGSVVALVSREKVQLQVG